MRVTDMDYIGKLGGKNAVLRRFLLILVTLLTFTIQNTGGLFPAPAGIHAMLLVPLTVCIAMFEREFAGLFFGLFAGAMLDAFSSQSICYHAVALTIIGFAAGALITYLMRNNLTCAVILCAISVFLYNTFYFIIHYAFSGIDNLLFTYLKYCLFSSLYTVIFTPIFYFTVRTIVKKYK